MQQKSFFGYSPLGFHRIAYVEWGQQATQHQPVVCVHGLTRNGRDFDRLAEVLQNKRRIVCPDIVGRGKSDWLSDPAYYSYAQYLNDTAALIARLDIETVDWVGTSMGGLMGILLAAQPNTPVRRLVINDVGPFIPVAAMRRIGAYVSQQPAFDDMNGVERHMRTIYAPFGPLSDTDWRHLATHGTRALPDGRLALAHDPAIGKNFLGLDKDADFWNFYDRIRCPVLVLRGTQSDIFPAAVAEEMTRRGPKAQLVEFAGIGHAPALTDPTQIKAVAGFLGV